MTQKQVESKKGNDAPLYRYKSPLREWLPLAPYKKEKPLDWSLTSVSSVPSTV